jgi:hypothetical protein
MHWERAWKWIFAVAGLLLASRIYFVQELLTLLLFFSVVFAMLLLVVVFSLVSLSLIERGMDFLEPRLYALASRARIMLSEPIYHLKRRGRRAKIQPEFIRYE